LREIEYQSLFEKIIFPGGSSMMPEKHGFFIGVIALTAFVFFFGGAAAAERLSIAVPVANVRSGPGTGYETLWNVGQYHPLIVLERSGVWCRFKDFEGDQGWIHADLLKPIPSVITAKDNCNIRSGPGERHDILFTVEKGVPFKVLQTKDKWLQVEHGDGDRGWIHSSLTW
jgi:SH3-like domain-containing protein